MQDTIDVIEENVNTYVDAAKLSHMNFIHSKKEEQRLEEED